MSGTPPIPRKHLALDTDWLTAVNAFLGFVLCAAIGTALAWSTLHGYVKPSRASWSTPFFAAFLIYIAAKGQSGKLFKAAVYAFAVGPISRVFLWLVRASDETALVNEVFVRWIYFLLCLGCCIYASYWFKTKIRHVESSTSPEARS